jgi:hypothetical protein
MVDTGSQGELAPLWTFLGEAVANPEHLEVVKRGAASIRAWRIENPSVLELTGAELRKADLTEADLQDADLTRANLGLADLREADLRGANLREANLRGAKLRHAELEGADPRGAKLRYAELNRADLRLPNLRGAQLNGADLRGAHLRGADLKATNLSRTLLDGADLSGSCCGETLLVEVDLSGVTGLETVRHRSPSTLGIETLYRSKGKIPAEFLRGCRRTRWPNHTYLPSLIGAEEAALYYSCFISSSHKDEELTQRLYSRMREEHLRVWYAPADMKAGEKIHEQVDRAILRFDKLLLVLSENSMGSEWVKTEIYKARQREIKENHRKLFPIRLVHYDEIR